MATDDDLEQLVSQISAELGPIAWRIRGKGGNEICAIAPSAERPYYTLFTAGASRTAMPVPDGRAEARYVELTLCLPATWFGADPKAALRSDERLWPLEMLESIAVVAGSGSWIGPLHTVGNGTPEAEPYIDGVDLCCALLCTPVLWPPALATIACGDRDIAMLGVLPIKRAEMTLRLEYGTEPLWRQLRRAGATELLDLDRRIPTTSYEPFGETELAALDRRSRRAACAGIASRESPALALLADYDDEEDLPRARSTGPYSSVTSRPYPSGEYVGLPHARSLVARGAPTVLRELWTIKSDDISGRARLRETLASGAPAMATSRPQTLTVLELELGAAGFELDARAALPTVRTLSADAIRARSRGEVRNAETLDEHDAPVSGGLLCPELFGERDGDTRFERWAHLELAAPVPHPWWRGRAAPPLTVLPIAPAGIRPIVRMRDGRYATSDLNDLYRAVIAANASGDVAQLETAVAALLCNGHGGVQTVNADTDRPLHGLDQLIAETLRTHHRRVDFSAAAATDACPELDPTQCYVPDAIVRSLFRHGGVGIVLVTPLQMHWSVQPIYACALTPADEPTIGLAPALLDALQIDEGDAVAIHVPLTPEALREARERLSYGGPSGEVASTVETEWIANAMDTSITTAIVDAVDRGLASSVDDLRVKLLLGRLL